MTAPKHLLVATGNVHKLEEIRTLFSIPGLELKCLKDYPPVDEVVEDGDSFEANAEKKAAETARHFRVWTLADDSGIEVDALDLAPGIHSARYAGVHGDDAANNRKLLAEMKGVTNRSARFRCVIALSDPKGFTRTVSGTVEGQIAPNESGTNGFGYDSLFIPDGYEESFGVLDPSIKSAISHRARALQQAWKAWLNLLRQGSLP